MEKKENENSSTYELKKRFLECPICLEEFNESAKLPKVLPCLHTFCFACLQEIHKESNVTCSLCLKPYETPDGKLDVFPTDLTRRDLLDFVHAGTEPEKLRCNNCDKSEPATAKYRCKDCQIYLCEECYDAHSKILQFKGHSLFCLDSASGNSISTIQEFARQETCDIVGHGNKPLEYFCRSQGCDKLICTSCFISEHTPHKTSVIRDVYEEKKQYLQEKGQNLEGRVSEIDAVIEQIESTLVGLELKRNETDKIIEASIDVSVSHIKRRGEALRIRNESIYQQKSKTLQIQLEGLNSFKESLVESRDFLNHSLSYRNEPAFLKIAKTINDRFESLLNEQIDQHPHETEDLKFSPINMGNTFAVSTHGLGVVFSEIADSKYTKISVPDDLQMNQEHVIDIQVRNSRGDKLSIDNLVDIGLEICCDKEKHLIQCHPVSDGVLEAKWIPDKEASYHLRLIYRCKEEELGEVEHVVVTGSPDFHLDETTLHSQTYLSEDKKSLFNIRHPASEQREGQPPTPCSYDWPTGSYKIHTGTRGSLLIKHPDQVYFEVGVTYDITKDLPSTWLVFEVGIAREDIIDLHHWVGSNQYGWSVYAACDDITGKVAIQCWHNKVRLHRETLSESKAGTSKTVTLGIYVNTQDKQMSVVNTDKDVLMYTITDIDFTQALRPVFGVYNPQNCDVILQLKTGAAIKRLPKCLVK